MQQPGKLHDSDPRVSGGHPRLYPLRLQRRPGRYDLHRQFRGAPPAYGHGSGVRLRGRSRFVVGV